MRKVKYLSPSSLGTFYKNRKEFYLRYLAEDRPPRLAQTRPMSVGAAFDAFIKNYLAVKLVGSLEDRFVLETMLRDQVEANFEWASTQGAYIFEQYQKLGSLGDLMLELEQALDVPRFEFKVEGRISHERTLDSGIPLLGKPDLYFHLREGGVCVFDFKVNGYCNRRAATSPKGGYIRCRGGVRDSGNPHRDATVLKMKGLDVNVGGSLFEDWAEQLTIYAWLLGAPIGSKFIVGIEQIVSQGNPGKGFPKLRVASHRAIISEDFQQALYEKIEYCWKTIASGHIFEDLTPAKSDQLCRELDQYHKAFGDPLDPKEKWFSKMVNR